MEYYLTTRIKGLNIKLPTSPYKLQTNENKSAIIVWDRKNIFLKILILKYLQYYFGSLEPISELLLALFSLTFFIL